MSMTLTSWYAVVPKRQTYRGRKRPTGSVCLRTAEAGTEYLSVPASVARALARVEDKDDPPIQTREELVSLVDSITNRMVQERVCKLLERREYTEKEAYTRLVEEGFSPSLAHEAVAHAADIGLISNKRFSNAFIRGKVSAGWGMQRIERELSRRGIDASSLDGWPYEYLNPDDEFERACEIGSRKRVREPNRYGKLVRFLVGRGFSYDVSLRAASMLCDETAGED